MFSTDLRMVEELAAMVKLKARWVSLRQIVPTRENPDAQEMHSLVPL